MNHSRGMARSLFNMRAERETQRAAIKHDKISLERVSSSPDVARMI